MTFRVGEEEEEEEALEVLEEEPTNPSIGAGASPHIVRNTIIEETTVLVGEITAQIGKAEGTIVQDTGRGIVDQEVEETTHQKRAEDTLAKIDEVVAKGPLVMEGP